MNTYQDEKKTIKELFEAARTAGTYLKICAPMVRYSKLEFRHLVKNYGTDLCYTSMIMADSYCQSEKARFNEFTTNQEDTPLIAQFAANNIPDFLSASEMIFPYVDGVDLNCGCPQRWAMNDGYGSALLKNPELISDLLKSVRRNLPSSFSVSVKVRLLQKSLKSTIEMCRQLEQSGITFITVHGRTPAEKTNVPVNKEALKDIKDSISIPLVANGDVFSLKDADEMFASTNCDGIMSARGILSNPSLFAGYDKTPIDCVRNWVNITRQADENITFQCMHHHLTFMTESIMKKPLRIAFNNLTTKESVYKFLEEHFDIVPDPTINGFSDKIFCKYDETKYKSRTKKIVNNEYSSENTDGTYFKSIVDNLESGNEDDNEDGLDFMDSNMFEM